MNTYQKEYARAHNKAYRQTVRGKFNTLVTDARKSARSRGHVCELTTLMLAKLWQAQDGRCRYTGWPMSFTTNSPDLVSVERINNDVGYVDGNVMLVCWCANRARNTMTEADFLHMCLAVVRHAAGNYDAGSWGSGHTTFQEPQSLAPSHTRGAQPASHNTISQCGTQATQPEWEQGTLVY